MKKQNKGFTLVELIVVITILAILGTIAFISLQGYSKDSRDSVRITDLSNIEKQLELYIVKGSKLPIPDEAITLESSGTIIGYQGYIGEESLNKIGVNGGGKDPLDDTYYTYRINATKTAYQIMGYLEDGTELSNIFSQTNAADLTKRFPELYGNVLGILVDQATNKPLDKIETGTFELQGDASNVDMYLSSIRKESGTPQTLFGKLEILSLNKSFAPPITCPTGFISVPGNRDLGQSGFCVAKYEMSFEGITGSGSGRNIYSYLDNGDAGTVVSQQGNSPIAFISEVEAIEECMAMGEGYHLITDSEWTTIARNIEQQSNNWSSGVVGNGYIPNGISEELTKGCDGNSADTKPYPTLRATVTGDNICSGKNKLTLSNGEEVWDLSGNLWELVNKANTIDGEGFDTGLTSFDLTSGNWTGNYQWHATGWSASSISESIRRKHGPLNSTFDHTTNGMGNIYGWNVLTEDNVIMRGGSASDTSSGVFALSLALQGNNTYHHVGFRCAK